MLEWLAGETETGHYLSAVGELFEGQDRPKQKLVKLRADYMQTDEYGISLSREITVCRNMIERQRKALSRLEKEYGISPERMTAAESTEASNPARGYQEWFNEYQGLRAWQKRLREYEEAYNSLKH